MPVRCLLRAARLVGTRFLVVGLWLVLAIAAVTAMGGALRDWFRLPAGPPLQDGFGIGRSAGETSSCDWQHRKSLSDLKE